MTYHSQLLRYWQEPDSESDAPPLWRFSLEDVRTGERLGFADLGALFTHLRSHIAALSHPTSATRPKDDDA